MDKHEFAELQLMPLRWKVLISKERIKDAIDRYGVDGLYISISGGKDSLVLHYVAQEVELELYGKLRIPRVFCNTGLEYPELKANLDRIFKGNEDLLIVLKPGMHFRDVITKYGYPVISKEQSSYIHEYKRSKSEKLKNIRLHGQNGTNVGKISTKWQYLIEADFNISHLCCDTMKKKPFKKYERETKRIPMLGILASESPTRLRSYLTNGGCNAFECTRPKSQPLGFWRESDILEYISVNKIVLPSVYGEIVKTEDGDYKVTGLTRTGCVFCAYGAHLDKGENRFQKLKKSHPNLYNYCMNGGKYNEEGLWVPEKGLGMRKVLATIGVKTDEEE